eukprot:179887_1
MVNITVLQWYFDQIAAYIGLVMAIILLMIIIKKFVSSSVKYPLTLQCSTYMVYISYIILFIVTALVSVGLTVSQTSNQQEFCKIIVPLSILCYGLSQISLINLFIERLRICFMNTSFELSKWTNYVFRIIIFIAWIIVCVFALQTVDASPFNIHTQETDYNGNGSTCNVITTGKQMTIGLLIAMLGNVLCVIVGNIFLLIIFMNKLLKLTKRMDAKHDSTLIDFILVMKEQTLIVSIAVCSTLFFWLLTASSIFGT